MQPKQQNDDRSLSIPTRDDNDSPRTDDREVAARLMREQIDRIYDQPIEVTTPDAQPKKTYSRSHDDTVAHQDAGGEWHRYHSAWQQYYQQYYERYYLQQLDHHRKRTAGPSIAPHNPFPITKQPEAQAEQGINKDTAVREIRAELINKVKKHSSKVQKSRHFIPIISAIVVMSLFLALQFNRVVVAQILSFISPGAVSPQNIIIDPTLDTKVGPEPKLIIPKINVEAPIVYGLQSIAEASVQTALKDGVVHYPIPGANSLPGQKGNSVILGHSSNDVFDDGKYKFIFVQLEQVQKGDTFYINYNGVRYTYSITSKEVILPSQVNKLVLPQDKPTVTLVTCVPIGTALKRLVVYADQISPDPAKAEANNSQPATSESVAIPGNSPTLFDRLFRN